jgi:acetylornithine deacetylase/succinyl-diaminopimelate desuccinylase-like protein
MDREALRSQALNYIESGGLLHDLRKLVARPSVSQSEGSPEDLWAYLTDDIGPLIEGYGFETSIYDNPLPDGPPLMIARHIEDTALPTVLIYGHGDVCNGEAHRWRDGLLPFELKQEDDRLYGRGTADNKAQHLINITALGLLLKANGRLGFNVKIVLEMGEETGSPGLREFLADKRYELAADVLIASDGPRLMPSIPTVFMGSRGAMDIDFTVRLRDRDYHSGNFGGLLADPAMLLAHALASITDQRGQICIPEWRPNSLTDDVRRTLSGLPHRQHDPDWGEETLTPSERAFGWNSFTILAISAGTLAAPQSAISGTARAIGQLRFVVGTKMDEILPSLRRHLDAGGFGMVAISCYGEPFKATRFSLDNPWVRFVCDSVERSSGTKPHILPNLAGSLPNDMFTDILGLPTIWVPHSYAECNQHGPNEHARLSIARQGIMIMTDLFLDLANNPPERK